MKQRTIRFWLAWGGEKLKNVGIGTHIREARILLAYAIQKREEWVFAYPENLVLGTDYKALVFRRAAREPLSHILGFREFWSLSFQVNAEVLDLSLIHI